VGRERLVVPGGRSVHRLIGAKMRGQTDVGQPEFGHPSQHLDRLLHGAGAVVHAGEEMGMEVDHVGGRPPGSSEAAKALSPAGASSA
jgi:hypothetical protein